MSDLIARAARANSHFFDRDTMRFFKSRVLDIHEIDANRYVFVTSERDESEPRRYTVRVATFGPRREDFAVQLLDGTYNFESVEIGTAPGHTFQEFASASTAKRRAGILAAKLKG